MENTPTTSEDDAHGAIGAGSGRIKLVLHGQRAIFSELSYKYPLKLLSPRVHHASVAIAYIITYGGGLVSGDRIHLDIVVESGAVLMLLTQGSTKVFKHRPGSRLSSIFTAMEVFDTSTTQRLESHIQKDGLLLLLPDPVTCYSEAAYNQLQTFRLADGASVVLLDWLTSGRMHRAEEWLFSRYYSINEVWLGKKRIARDVLLLQVEHDERNLMKERMAGYACYATLIIYGPRVQGLVKSLSGLYSETVVHVHSSPAEQIWSLNSIEGGCIVRVAARETQTVKDWLRDQLRVLAKDIGQDILEKPFI